MFARRSTVSGAGLRFETPLLLPAFSSKGFEFAQSDEDVSGFSVISEALEFAAPSLTEAFLLSAYDIHYEHLRDITNYFSMPDVLFVDSGGYERDPEFDSADEYRHPYKPKDWSKDLLIETLRGLPEHLACVIANLDKRASFEDQVKDAQEFFAEFPHFASDFLVKPEPRHTYLNIDRLGAFAEDMGAFSMVGVTEKELGDKMMDRLRALAKLRQRLDEAGVPVPIHVFGSLDPLMSPLYFIAGAEIFDGLSWLRYSFTNGLAAHPEALAALGGHWDHHRNQRRASMLSNNLDTLTDLTYAMKRFLLREGGDFGAFQHHADLLEKAYLDLMTRIRGGGRGR